MKKETLDKFTKGMRAFARFNNEGTYSEPTATSVIRGKTVDKCFETRTCKRGAHHGKAVLVVYSDRSDTFRLYEPQLALVGDQINNYDSGFADGFAAALEVLASMQEGTQHNADILAGCIITLAEYDEDERMVQLKTAVEKFDYRHLRRALYEYEQD